MAIYTGISNCVLLFSMIWKCKVEQVSITAAAPIVGLLFTLINDSVVQVGRLRLVSNIRDNLKQIEEFLAVPERLESRQLQALNQTAISNNPSIRITGLTCHTDGTTQPALHNLDITLKSGTVTMLHGASGSSKAAIFGLALGDIIPAEGTVEISNCPIASCSQTTWLQKASIKSNIISFSEMDDIWYNKVISACNLQPDFEGFPLRDSTIIGNNTSNVNTVQKMKIASQITNSIGDVLTIYTLGTGPRDLQQGADTSIRRRIFYFGQCYGVENYSIIILTQEWPFETIWCHSRIGRPSM